jgi:redox-sensitive bicupin YhaK (pirin superfamily)
LRHGRTLASGRVLTMGIDDATQRPPTDLPAEEQRIEPSVREQMPPSAVERIEAHLQARRVTDKAYAERTGAEISGGHAFDKHVVDQAEFPGVTTREQFADLIEGAVMNGESRALSGDRTAYWSDGTVVIRHPGTEDGGTAFRPANGYDYFLGLH